MCSASAARKDTAEVGQDQCSGVCCGWLRREGRVRMGLSRESLEAKGERREGWELGRKEGQKEMERERWNPGHKE